MSTEPDYLLCSPVIVAGRVAEVVEGSTITHCTSCGCDVWIAPSGTTSVAQLALVVLCVPCGARRIAADPGPTFAGLAPGQLAELRQHYQADPR